MQASEFWYQFAVHSKKAVAAGLLSLFFQCVSAQHIVYEDDVRFARRDFHFGISLGLNFSMALAFCFWRLFMRRIRPNINNTPNDESNAVYLILFL